jgi:hypothetical protein
MRINAVKYKKAVTSLTSPKHQSKDQTLQAPNRMLNQELIGKRAKLSPAEEYHDNGKVSQPLRLQSLYNVSGSAQQPETARFNQPT